MAEKRAQNLRIELLVTLALLVGLTVMSLSLVTQALARSRHDVREVERLDVYARGIASLASNHFHGPTEFDRATLVELLQQSISTQLGVRSMGLYMVSPRGASLLLSVGGELPEAPPAFGDEGLDARGSTLGERLILDARVPTFGGSRDAARPVLRITATPESWVQEGVLTQLFLVSLAITALVLLAGSLLLNAKILSPMRTLSEATRRIAQGDLRTPVPEEGPTEFVDLARDFNGMAASLDAEREANLRQAAALRRSEQLAAVGKLAAGVAHEVGNPLAAVHGYLEFLLDPREGLSDAHAEILRTMGTQTERIQNIVAQMLDYSRPRELVTIQCDLRNELLRAVELVRMDPRAKSIRVTVTPGPTVCIETDPTFLSQILINLLLNAVIAASDGEGPGEVVATVIEDTSDSDRDDGCRIQICDDGDGLDPALSEKIFEPFFTTRPAGEGTGLGLAMTRGLAERLDGAVRYLPADDPERPASPSGACFELCLPLQPVGTDVADAIAAPTPSQQPTPHVSSPAQAPAAPSDARL